MSPARKRTYEELLPIWDIRDDVVNWRGMFPGANRNIVEIGFGMGDATRQVAAAHPDWGILGIEVHTPGVGKLLWWIKEESLTNVRIACKDAVEVFRHQIPPSSVDAVHIWFPDPWPKKKHHKRRLINPEFVSLLTQSLTDGGIIHAATDWEPYAEHILATLGGQRGLRNRHSPWAPKPDYRPHTKFEEKGKSAERVIRDIIFERKD